MNENVQTKLELLKVMKDLNGQNYRLNSEISALIKNILSDVNVTTGMINNVNNNDVMEKFKLNISKDSNKHGKLVFVNTTDRGVGKTTELIKMANELSVPIIVQNSQYKSHIHHSVKEGNFKSPVVYTVAEYGGKRSHKGVLLDESVELGCHNEISKNTTIRGGFCKSNYIVN